MPGPALSFCFLGEQGCECMLKRGPSLAYCPSYYALLSLLSPPSPNRDWLWGMGKGALGRKGLCPLQLEEGRVFGGCLAHPSIPPHSSSLLKENKKSARLFTVSMNPCGFLATLGVNGIFMGKDPTCLPFRYLTNQLFVQCLWNHCLLNSMNIIKVGSFD